MAHKILFITSCSNLVWFCLLNFVKFTVWISLTCQLNLIKARIASEPNNLSFMMEPSDTLARKGSSVLLDCIVEGNPVPTVTWRKDYVPLNLINDPDRRLLPNGTLYIASVSHRRSTYSDAGIYQCVADSPNVGRIVSTNAELIVAGLPKFDEEPMDLSIYEEEVARFACSIKSRPSAKIYWFWNGRPLLLDSRMTLLPSGALEIQAVALEDQGEYYCSASNFGKAKLSQKAVLKVEKALALRDPAAPSFIAVPKSVKTKVGSNITLDCAANGYPAPTVAWLKDGATIDMLNLDSRFLFVGATRSLLLTNIRVKDEGTYMCRAQNKLDSVDAVAEISVEDIPRITEGPVDTVASEREDVELVCKVSGRPEPTITWLKNGDIIKENEYFLFDKGTNLRILGIVPSDAGMYQCLASNDAGQVQSSAHLRVMKANFNGISNGKDANLSPFFNGSPDKSNLAPKGRTPSSPRHLQPVVSSNRFVTLSWHEPEFNNENIVGYSVFYRQEGSDRERVQNVSASSSLNDLDVYKTQVGQLIPESTYLVRVVAHTSDGLVGKSSPAVQFTTSPDLDLPGPPRNLKAFSTSSKSISVSWGPPPSTKTPVSGYVLYYMEVGSAEEHDLDLQQTSYELTNLNEFTEYSFWLVAVNANGMGDPTHEVTARTFSASPSGPPQNVTSEAVSSRSLIIRWEPPPITDQNGVITGYKIRYKERKTSRAVTKTTDGSRRLFPLTDLEKDTAYVIKLSAMTVNGSGPSTAWIQSRTFANDLDENRVPGKPASIRAIPFRDSIEVHWRPPHSQDVLIKGYKIGWGKGIPDEMTAMTESNQRSYLINDLEPNADYVITLLAYNSRGPGSPIYEQVRTLLKKKEPVATLTPPVGLKTEALTSYSISLQWTDTTLNRNQYIGDRGYYTVRYTTFASASSFSPRYKYENVSDVAALIDSLKPATVYEFSVKAVKGHRESPWSLVVTQATVDARPSSPPRDVTVVTLADDPAKVIVNWQPPKLANGKLSGYFIYYTTDPSGDWAMEEVHGDKMSLTLRHLTPSTIYYYKMQAENDKGFGPFSPISNFTTLSGIGAGALLPTSPLGVSGDSFIVFVVGGIIGASSFILVIVALLVFCKRGSLRRNTREGIRTPLPKDKVEVKPPDLWIHHDHLELKNLNNKNQNSPTRPKAMNHLGHEMDCEDRNTTFTSSSTLDRRTPYQSAYLREHFSDDETDKLLNRRSFKPKPLIISLASTKDSVIGGSTSSSVYSDGTMGRPGYSIPQYPAPNAQGYISPQENPYATNHSSTLGSNDGCNTLGKRPGNPLRSFSVPAPPQSAPTTPQQPKHIATVRPQGSKSPFKKALNLPPPSGALPNNIPVSARRVLPATRVDSFPEQEEEMNEGLLHGFSTEELTQEMANLEGLMKDLSAITANQFNC